MTNKTHVADISIVMGLLALVVFGHLSMWRGTAHAGGIAPLQLQGTGAAYSSYSVQVNENLGQMENNARYKLYELGAAEYSYASSRPGGKYAYLDELLMQGYLQPNQSGRTLIPSYSVTFFLPSGRRGFTLIAEPSSFDLRSFMLTENQRVVLITPSASGDPNEDWHTVRTMMFNFAQDHGYYDYLNNLMLLSYDPPMQVRLNRERSAYVIHQIKPNPDVGYSPDESLVYLSSYASYLIGDTREYPLEE